MSRKERRALDLADRKREKKARKEARDTPPLEFLARKRAAYVAQWEPKGCALLESGDYEWMASLLPAAGGRLLEVGTGSGHGTRILVRRGWRVIGVDENDACLRATQALLAEHAVACALRSRGRPYEAESGAYGVDYSGYATPSDAPVALIEGDILDDPELPDVLASYGPFDAVAAWLLDSHEARAAHRKVVEIGIRAPAEYRVGVQKLVYGLAGRVLRGDGVLQVVDRAEQPVSEALAAGYLRLRDAQARGTTLELQALDVRGDLVSVRSRRRS